MMSLDFDQILAADQVYHFHYLDQMSPQLGYFPMEEKNSTEQEHRDEESFLRNDDLFGGDLIYPNIQKYCKNSEFKKKIAALNLEYAQKTNVQQSYQDKDKLSSCYIEPQRLDSFPQRESNSNFSQRKINQSRKQGKKILKNQSQKDPYPTKNILPCFRSFFLNYILQKDPQCKKLEIIKRIQGKACINLNDYEDLFNQPRVRPILTIYFKTNQLYRDLLQSRVQFKLKMTYLKKIGVFYKAFTSGVFPRIN